MSKVFLRWGAWYGDLQTVLEFPEGWEVSVHGPLDAPGIGDSEVRGALASPIGSESLSETARGKHGAAIIVDDLTRPTPAHRVLPAVMRELAEGGIRRDGVRIVMGTAAHRPLVRPDLVKKLGREAVDTLDVMNHNPYENLVYLGISSIGTPMHINKDVMDADLKVGVGSILPHPAAGFGGGAKIVLPGISGMETIAHNHAKTASEGRHGRLDGNPMRADVEEVARRAGLDFIANVVVNSRREVAGSSRATW